MVFANFGFAEFRAIFLLHLRRQAHGKGIFYRVEKLLAAADAIFIDTGGRLDVGRGLTWILHGERGVVLLVVDVQVDDVSGNFLFTEELGNLPDAGFGIVAVAALLVAQCEQRRQRHAPGKRGVVG